ncbi:Putative zinc-finger [Nonomuraea solani]|uniref:Putative zinc-finger n=1 Tax=Nonomuraea solani TaxID=1144553 RepID=A0A1H5VK96_9ACTN|nr:zf-HC2 domain-containing protein [Nonomuraea solani]SEF87699.1 Putative zinc-finger [Nonomuraea solani]
MERAREGRADELGCADVCELLTDYLEQALPDGRREAVTRHLHRCRGCDAWLAQVLATIAALRCLRAGAISPPVLAALRESFTAS